MSRPVALYVHWPFCQSKCPYCDFNSHVGKSIDHAEWREGLLAELEHYAAETSGRFVSSLYFGGGTPSLMKAGTVAAIIDAAEDLWGLAEGIEITLEANPSSAEAARFRDYHTAGVNRVSVGVQSLNDSALTFLGRRHNAAEARRALCDTAHIFDRFSFDMIYGLPGQTVESWRDELVEALAMAAGHISVYQLAIEPGTVFFRDHVRAADEDLSADLFTLTRELLCDAGLPAYEVSNHAGPGRKSRHNLTYWRGGDYIGVGPGAHGRLNIGAEFVATHQIHDPLRWLEKVTKTGHGTAKRRYLEPSERAEEMIMAGLRLAEGLDVSRLQELSGLMLDDMLDPNKLEQCLKAELLYWQEQHLTATERGTACLNALTAALLAPAKPILSLSRNKISLEPAGSP